jgi:3-oxoacyl-[acyl-carrier protein] reductase
MPFASLPACAYRLAGVYPQGLQLDVKLQHTIGQPTGLEQVRCRAAAQFMVQGGGGAIVNIASIKGREEASSPGYAASKAGVIGLTRSLAKELVSRGIRVNCVAPGYIDAGMSHLLGSPERAAAIAKIPLGRFGLPSEVADVVRFLASAGASYIAGATIDVNGGCLMP